MPAPLPASSMPAPSPSTSSPPSAPPSVSAAACCPSMAGSSGYKQAAASKPFYLSLMDRSPLSFAALWERWDKASTTLESFTIITTVASPGLEDLHHCQPAIIHPRWFSYWLNPRSPLPALLELVRQPHDGPFQRRAVSTRVNSVRNDDPVILLPLPESEMF